MKSYSKETAVGIFVLICLLCVGYLTIKLGKMQLGSSNTYTVYAKFESAAGLRAGAGVEIAGVPVGKVAGVSLDQEDYLATVALAIQNNVKLSDDIIASIKTSGLIGDKYIKLTPGGSPDLLEDGSEITDTESAVDIEELISKYVFGGV
ncbi:outer membrane lipid asymmetry maintenance protein MlaD [Halodesulfovibrio aestuarii]|uniref:Outer membrane lipid asymmetry maintenance protein MlaD n=1 Tax=Halodesulfovibrio aestuarii TaxID=126333 RepID=A0A8G2FGB3_9BACT|nr:outer membrane lipid asymmetry maintenance protein MlaD [Halodesulfovibrio aestuarii]SHI47009.1 phospholipid/cholesterol/gamma-HCH transport system substrate-binding protein [Halodesulfovibrio aestuarii]